ncbi:hypothetical protein NCCP2331_26560 [Sporosarcina sp. NCCP-2331]|nr:hypothetical protein NCCP2331_26560 [Sporosarcina sp. NCCP-2331]GLB56780.1 hypothetical protein NCCP2378_25670 [Sporosarcina sp. NCCP-2378]
MGEPNDAGHQYIGKFIEDSQQDQEYGQCDAMSQIVYSRARFFTEKVANHEYVWH